MRRWKRTVLTCFRLGLFAAAFLCLHLAADRREGVRTATLDPSVVLAPVRALLPAAASLGAPLDGDRLAPVLNSGGETIGFAAQTFPEAREITGYNGASNLLVIFDGGGRVAGTELLESADTAGHLAKIAADPGFYQQWNGDTASRFGAAGSPVVVSGASLTSEAIARGLASRFGAEDAGQWFPDGISIESIRPWFPEAAGIDGTRVLDAGGEQLGILLRSSRMRVAVRGFQAPSDVLVALDPAGEKLIGVGLPASRDNAPYTDDVADTLRYDTPFAGLPVDVFLKRPASETLVTSGASRTGEAVEESVREMLFRHRQARPAPPSATDPKTLAALSWIAFSIVFALRRKPKHAGTGFRRISRFLFPIATVLISGLWLGLMTGQDQWIQSAIRGSLQGIALPLLTLSAAALLVPAAFGKNIYCSHLCAHGAAQTLLGGARVSRFTLPSRVHRLLASVPWLGLFGLWLIAFIGIRFPFAHAEPFEVWSTGFIALVPSLVFLAGLIASAFLPQAYCRYGCPTGAALRFLTASPSCWTRRDTAASVIVACAWGVFLLS